jgi:hypothetical protein
MEASVIYSFQDALGHRPDLPEYVENLGDEYEPVTFFFK